MQCPECGCTHIRKNGKKQGKHSSHLCCWWSPVHQGRRTTERLLRYGSARSVVTHGGSVYPGFIPDGDQIVSKTYMTRVEGENTRQRHSANSTASQDTVVFQIRRTTETLNQIVTTLSEVLGFSGCSIIYTAIDRHQKGDAVSVTAIFKLPFSRFGVGYLAPTSSPSEGSFFLLLPILQAFSIRSYKTLVS